MYGSQESHDPAKIDVMALSSALMNEKRWLPEIPCVYFVLTAEHAVLYVGQSRNLCRRWKNHNRLALYRQMPGVRIAWLTVSEDRLLPYLEKACIAYFSPRDNGKTFPGGYRLQVIASHELRVVLHAIADKEQIGINRLIIKLLTEKLQERPEGQHLALVDED